MRAEDSQAWAVKSCWSAFERHSVGGEAHYHFVMRKGVLRYWEYWRCEDF